MFEFLKSEKFNLFFSFLIGLAIMTLFKPSCKGECVTHKAPPLEEVKAATYQMGEKCYQFRAETVDCPAAGSKGVVESFQLKPLFERGEENPAF